MVRNLREPKTGAYSHHTRYQETTQPSGRWALWRFEFEWIFWNILVLQMPMTALYGTTGTDDLVEKNRGVVPKDLDKYVFYIRLLLNRIRFRRTNLSSPVHRDKPPKPWLRSTEFVVKRILKDIPKGNPQRINEGILVGLNAEIPERIPERSKEEIL